MRRCIRFLCCQVFIEIKNTLELQAYIVLNEYHLYSKLCITDDLRGVKAVSTIRVHNAQ
jgi:hypothetical protein